jgi:hypothetical protein
MEDQSQINPYQAPDLPADVVKAQLQREFDPLPCPKCGNPHVVATPYSAWYGRRAPKAVQDVTCQKCRCNFNGETGIEYPPRKNPMIWFIISLVLFLLYLIVYFGIIIPATIKAPF